MRGHPGSAVSAGKYFLRKIDQCQSGKETNLLDGDGTRGRVTQARDADNMSTENWGPTCKSRMVGIS